MDNSFQRGLNVNDQSDDEHAQTAHETHQQRAVETTSTNTEHNHANSNDTYLNITVSPPIPNESDLQPANDDNDDNDNDNDNDIEMEEPEEADTNEHGNGNRYQRLLTRMQRRKNLKSYLTQVTKSKQKQYITKKKKLQQMLLDRNNEQEYNTAFEPSLTPNAPKFRKLSSRSKFPEISFSEWIIKEGVVLNDILNEIYNAPPIDDEHHTDDDHDDLTNNNQTESSLSSESTPFSSANGSSSNNNNKPVHSHSGKLAATRSSDLYIGYIPDEISILITSYTLDLLPGIYEFEGSMDYNGTDDESDGNGNGNGSGSSHRGWGAYGWGAGNQCTCQIILNSRAEIIGGHFTENSFKYHITNGSYTYDRPYCIEFTKEYFNYNYKYKVYGALQRDEQEKLIFDGHWKLLDGLRGGRVRMNYLESKLGAKQNQKLSGGQYQFYGHCEYLPNTTPNRFFSDRQRIKCCLRLNQRDFKIQGFVKLLHGVRAQTFGWLDYRGLDSILSQFAEQDGDANEDEDENDNVFVIDEKESEWDMYGGLHVQLLSGYVMEGFFNGEDFMGVVKDERLQRFGHFHFELYTPTQRGQDCSTNGDSKEDEDESESDNENDEDEQKLDVLLSSSYDLQRAKSLDSDEDLHEQHDEHDVD